MHGEICINLLGLTLMSSSLNFLPSLVETSLIFAAGRGTGPLQARAVGASIRTTLAPTKLERLVYGSKLSPKRRNEIAGSGNLTLPMLLQKLCAGEAAA